jgi:hypothetical protein
VIQKTAAIKVERRSIAAAVFIQDRLDYTQVHRLPSEGHKAQASAVGFVTWLTTALEVDSCVLETAPANDELRRSLLSQRVTQTFRDSGIPVWEIRKKRILASYGLPPLRSRKELREVITSIWPILSTSPHDDGIKDAVAIGLLFATDRIFNGVH